MTRRARFLLLPLAILAASACGKKGPILAPLLRVPQTLQDVSLSRVGNRVLLSWSNPESYIDGNPLLGLSEVEVWVVEGAGAAGAPAEKPAKGDVETKGRLAMKLPVGRPSPGAKDEPPVRRASAVLEPDPALMAQKSLFFSLRARDEKRRASEFSDPVVLESGTAPSPPGNVTVSVSEKSIDLAWAPPAGPGKIAGYNLYRSEGEEPPVRLNAGPLVPPRYKDENFHFGRVYVYFVRSAGGTTGALESENSESVKVEPVDKFPPAAPRGLTTISGAGFIALSWEPSGEPDLAGYRVWRSGPGEPGPRLLKELSPAESSFSDTEVVNGRQYVYAITAFDRAGNESGRSVEAAAAARRPRD